MTKAATSSNLLARHPTGANHGQLQMTADCKRSSTDTLELCFRVDGPLEAFRLPRLKPEPRRLDKLWRHSCFEAFIRIEGETGYWEYNLSPSGDWAHYRFAGYRSEVESPPSPAPAIKVDNRNHGYKLHALIHVPAGVPLRLGLSAIMEDQAGQLSYWALLHPAPQPDFHHPDAFVLRIE